jgi:hypothetical protein
MILRFKFNAAKIVCFLETTKLYSNKNNEKMHAPQHRPGDAKIMIIFGINAKKDIFFLCCGIIGVLLQAICDGS